MHADQSRVNLFIGIQTFINNSEPVKGVLKEDERWREKSFSNMYNSENIYVWF